MSRSAAATGILTSALFAAGCAPYLTPYGSAYGKPPIARLYSAHVDPITAARGRWDLVMRLPVNSVIDVLTWDDGSRVGNLVGADGYTLRLLVRGNVQQIARGDVIRLDLVSLPGSDGAAIARRTAGGALLGVGAAILCGAVLGGPVWPPPGIAFRMGAAVGGLTGAYAETVARQPRLVYFAENQQPPQSRPRSGGGVPQPGTIASYRVEEWAAITRLERGSRIAVLTTAGDRHIGTFIAASDDELRIGYRAAELRVRRGDVARVDVFDRNADSAIRPGQHRV